jgi:hypothetical protein
MGRMMKAAATRRCVSWRGEHQWSKLDGSWFIFNPAWMVHREITGRDEPAEFFVDDPGPSPGVVCCRDGAVPLTLPGS